MRMYNAAVTMERGLLFFCAYADNHVALLLINIIKWVDQGGLSIRLSGYPACLWNQGVRGSTVHYPNFMPPLARVSSRMGGEGLRALQNIWPLPHLLKCDDVIIIQKLGGKVHPSPPY